MVVSDHADLHGEEAQLNQHHELLKNSMSLLCRSVRADVCPLAVCPRYSEWFWGGKTTGADPWVKGATGTALDQVEPKHSAAPSCSCCSALLRFPVRCGSRTRFDFLFQDTQSSQPVKLSLLLYAIPLFLL